MDEHPMPRTTLSRSKSFIACYALAAAVVALTSGAAIYASISPSGAASLIGGIDTQVALFLVPLAVLMFAIIAEVLHATLRGVTPARIDRPARPIRHWTPGHGEG